MESVFDPNNLSPCPDLLAKTIENLCNRLVEMMHPDGFWEGRLSSSALSTATAISALSLADDEDDVSRIASGVAWLVEYQNTDGGWGDTTDSPSNLATTLLAVAALKLAINAGASRSQLDKTFERADEYSKLHGIGNHRDILEAVKREYGADRTFAIPILTNCGLAGLVSWTDIPGLPFELAVFPHSWYKVLRLHVVSYALPALIAIGLLLDRRNPSRSFLRRALHRAITPFVLEKLRRIQPDSGGFLEATPLTSFVAMGLIPLFGPDQPVAANCLKFLRLSQRSDGSWPIDTNLSVWLTTAAVAALGAANKLDRIAHKGTAKWISDRQYRATHPYTHAAPGGWAWTHLAGGVPDVDDTSGAIIAIRELGQNDRVKIGMRWLLELQNSDGGWPTFCRGWGKLPFDKSAPDLTAHALRALAECDPNKIHSPERAIRKGLKYLYNVQQSDGSWIPLWFGNQGTSQRSNPVIGTSLVLRALEILDRHGPQAARGVQYLLKTQNADGGWGGAKGTASSLEETAMAVAAIAPWGQSPETRNAFFRGAAYLIKESEKFLDRPVPIGLYFSHLWYSEKLYPLIWTIEALGRLMKNSTSISRQ
jgi:squalene-hopene/tetraprenyl-beta-curcumene cyclase